MTMKKNKIILILALFVILILCVSAKVEKKITVTDIPRQYIGKYAFLALSTIKNNDVVALTMPSKVIRSDSITMSFIDAKSFKPYTANGTFMFMMSITETDDTKSKDLYTGASLSIKISKEETTISFDDLMKL